MIDDRFYLLPYGVDAKTPADLKASAISANEFHDEVAELAKYGLVLVLLDACQRRLVAFDNLGQQCDGANVLHQKRNSRAKTKRGTMARSPKCCSTH